MLWVIYCDGYLFLFIHSSYKPIRIDEQSYLHTRHALGLADKTYGLFRVRTNKTIEG